MLDALSVMYDEELMHDDLHSNNVLIYTPPNSQPRPILIDFGSVKSRGHTKKERDDIRNLATHIALILNEISLRSEAKSQEEELILKACQGLHAVINDDDPLRRPENPKEIYRSYHDNFPRGSIQQRLKHPFDFGNSEEVLDNKLLHSLAAETFPWKERIENSSNLLVIGPRGCGKTTIFRSMSFVCLADADKLQDALSRTYIGLYISCNKDFRQRFSSLDEDILKSRENEVRHYFNLLVLREYIGTLKACEKGENLLESDLTVFLEFIEAKLDWKILKSFKVKALFLTEIEGIVIREIDLVRSSISNNEPIPTTTHQGFISDLVILSREKISPFLGKEFYLFIDDYTERKVPREIQRALNHVLFVPNGDFKTKISSEVFGVIPDQTFGSFIDQDRDYRELNLGTLYYANLPDRDQKAFLKEIINKRLKLCAYDGAVDSVIGPSEYPEGTLARSIRVEHEERKKIKGDTPSLRDSELDEKIHSDKKKAYYHGWDTICDLCTGDIGNILELLNRMYRTNKIEINHTKIIPPHKQDQSIQLYSRQLISKIKGIPQYGEKLFELVNSFGSYSAEILKEHPWVDRGERKDPKQTIRIELDEGYIRKNDTISFFYSEQVTKADSELDEPTILWMLLQRYSIFIDAEESRSRRNTLASKVILRRIFCPAFGISLTNSESLTIDGPNWRAFCKDPQGQGKILAKRKIKESEEATENGHQTTMQFEG